MTALILLSKFRETEIEIWRPITKLPGYDISNLGRLRSWRVREKALKGRGSVSGRRERPYLRKLNPQPKTGRLAANVCIDGKILTVRIAQLVAEAFIPNPKHLPEVNHKTGRRNDNRVGNLEWCTPEENNDHATTYGLRPRGQSHSNAKLTDDLVREIRLRCASGESQRSIGRDLGISQTVVGNVNRRKYWRHVE